VLRLPVGEKGNKMGGEGGEERILKTLERVVRFWALGEGGET